MGSFSDFLENELLDHVFKVGAYTAATNLFVVLLNTTPDDDDTGTVLSTAKEVSGGSYARVTCNTWDAASGGATANTGAITFAEATADWGTVTHFAICDHASTGNMLGWGALTTPKAIGTGDTASFAAGDLDVSIT
jgi:hypothetical protein